MMLFYLDESGTGLGDPQSPFFVLAAVSIAAEVWREMDMRVTALKERVIPWARPEDFEIKGREIRRGEKFFASMDWETRLRVLTDVARLIAELPCQIYAVQVDKRELPPDISSDDMMYRLALSRLLHEIDQDLRRLDSPGMLLFDMRSDMHSSVQDRRLVDAYRTWVDTRREPTKLIELPWFGFSAFYPGIQLADFCAYVIDFMHNDSVVRRRRPPPPHAPPPIGQRPPYDRQAPRGARELERILALLQPKLKLLRVP